MYSYHSYALFISKPKISKIAASSRCQRSTNAFDSSVATKVLAALSATCVLPAPEKRHHFPTLHQFADRRCATISSQFNLPNNDNCSKTIDSYPDHFNQSVWTSLSNRFPSSRILLHQSRHTREQGCFARYFRQPYCTSIQSALALLMYGWLPCYTSITQIF